MKKYCNVNSFTVSFFKIAEICSPGGDPILVERSCAGRVTEMLYMGPNHEVVDRRFFMDVFL